MQTVKALPPCLREIAAAHAQGRFAVLSIDHQFIMTASSEAEVSDFQDYQHGHAKALAVLRAHDVPIIHTAYCFTDAYLQRTYNDRKLAAYKSQAKRYHHDKSAMTLYNADAASPGGAVELDLLGVVKDGERFFPKYGCDAFDNPALSVHVKKQDYAILGIVGLYGPDCITTTMRSASKICDSTGKACGIVGLIDAIDSRVPCPSRAKRLQRNRAFFTNKIPEVLLTTANAFNASVKLYESGSRTPNAAAPQ